MWICGQVSYAIAITYVVCFFLNVCSVTLTDYTYDFVEISYGNFRQTYCGDEEDPFGDPGPFTNISTTMSVKFNTDAANPRSGFLAVVCCNVNVTKLVMSCELNLT